jgi:hypothetical protein
LTRLFRFGLRAWRGGEPWRWWAINQEDVEAARQAGLEASDRTMIACHSRRQRKPDPLTRQIDEVLFR